MTDEQLRTAIHKANPGVELEKLERNKLLQLYTSLPRRKQKRRTRRPRMLKNLGVGRYCRELLKKVVRRDRENNPVGLSYMKMKELAKKKFPDSAVDEKHLRWYAAKMRRDGENIPVHRERSIWK